MIWYSNISLSDRIFNKIVQFHKVWVYWKYNWQLTLDVLSLWAKQHKYFMMQHTSYNLINQLLHHFINNNESNCNENYLHHAKFCNIYNKLESIYSTKLTKTSKNIAWCYCVFLWSTTKLVIDGTSKGLTVVINGLVS